ncbi:hypothetical protein L596_018717 [Steinernema carpocapsae]|uniref:Uncharacterized protein n=1 Tax=Steinernema carpocapsae TaxID=34508 RepID=A0A4U5N5G4_STECR|nr:hypothetical protein L596_018717 [Steinernema carpocapsae]
MIDAFIGFCAFTILVPFLFGECCRKRSKKEAKAEKPTPIEGSATPPAPASTGIDVKLDENQSIKTDKTQEETEPTQENTPPFSPAANGNEKN